MLKLRKEISLYGEKEERRRSICWSCSKYTQTEKIQNSQHKTQQPTAPFVALGDQSSSAFLMHDGDEFDISMGWQGTSEKHQNIVKRGHAP